LANNLFSHFTEARKECKVEKSEEKKQKQRKSGRKSRRTLEVDKSVKGLCHYVVGYVVDIAGVDVDVVDGDGDTC